MTTPPSPSAPPEKETPKPRPRLNAVGEERPAFLLEYPHDPELEALIAAYESGDFKKIRDEAPALARRTHDEAVRQAALELRLRTQPDRLLVFFLLLSIGLLLFLAVWVYT
jgi:hypothetical protein